MKFRKNKAMKHAIVTGARGNLGSAVCATLTGAGYHVHGTVRKPETVDSPSQPGTLSLHTLDLLDEDACSAFVSSFDAPPQVAILTAGGYGGGTLNKTSSGDIGKMISLNFYTAYHILRPLWRAWETHQTPGTLIVIGARPVLEPPLAEGKLGYTLSKTLLVQTVRALNASNTIPGRRILACVPDTLDTPENRESMPGANRQKWVPPSTIARWVLERIQDEVPGLSQGIYTFYG